MTDILKDLSVEWAHVDGQGLVRVLPTDTYRTGFVVIAAIGPIAERNEYYPDMMLSRDKITITIDDEDEQKAHDLAAAIDAILVTDDTEEE